MKYLFLGEFLLLAQQNTKSLGELLLLAVPKYQVPGFRPCKLTGKLLALFMVCFYPIG